MKVATNYLSLTFWIIKIE